MEIRARLAASKEGREKRRVIWANRDAIIEIYRQAVVMTRTTGRLHVVDHIIPLQGRTVSGLHVETNLRVIEHRENARKHNFWKSPGWQRPGDEAAPPHQSWCRGRAAFSSSQRLLLARRLGYGPPCERPLSARGRT